MSASVMFPQFPSYSLLSPLKSWQTEAALKCFHYKGPLSDYVEGSVIVLRPVLSSYLLPPQWLQHRPRTFFRHFARLHSPANAIFSP